MSAPITQTDKTLLPFDARLKLVSAEVAARVAAYPANEQNYQRARLWCGWIKKSLLPDAEVTARPVSVQYFDNPAWEV